MKTRVLVTGANGQLGKTIKELYPTNEGEIQFTFTTKAELDITIKDRVEEFFNKNNFDYCINCAAYTNVDQAERDTKSAYKVNAKAVKYLAQTCKKTNTILIHISTDYVFDGNKNEPYKELDTPNPINEYGKSKLLGEQHIQEISQKHFIIRTSWLYSKYGKNFVKSIVNKIQENTELRITTSQEGTPTSCIDLSKFIYFLIKCNTNNYGIYHFTAIGETTWYDLAIQISKHFSQYNSSNIIPVKAYNSKAIRPLYSVLNNSKAQRLFSKKCDWRKSVDEVVKTLTNNQ
jgi:dTDP-4-dehydrorhamnose reductase